MSQHTITIIDTWAVHRGQGYDVYATGACSCGKSVGMSLSTLELGWVAGVLKCACGADRIWDTDVYDQLLRGEGRPAITITGD